GLAPVGERIASQDRLMVRDLGEALDNIWQHRLPPPWKILLDIWCSGLTGMTSWCHNAQACLSCQYIGAHYHVEIARHRRQEHCPATAGAHTKQGLGRYGKTSRTAPACRGNGRQPGVAARGDHH